MYLLFPSSMRDLEIIGEARRQEDGGLAKIDIRVRLSNGPVACKIRGLGGKQPHTSLMLRPHPVFAVHRLTHRLLSTLELAFIARMC